MMHHPSGMSGQASMAPPPGGGEQQSLPPQWGVVPPPAPTSQYHQQPQLLPQMWNQHPSQFSPPIPPAQNAPQQQLYQSPAPSSHAHPSSSEEVRTLWIGDLQYWMDESYLYACFPQTGEVVSLKIIRNKQTGQSEGYGFVQFTSRAVAEHILQTYNGQPMPNAQQAFRMNWASHGAGEKRVDDGVEFTIFVGDLAPEVTDFILQEIFKSRYPSVKGANVVMDRVTGRSKGYGFVRFADSKEQEQAMTEMNGMYYSTRAMRIGPAATKKSSGFPQQYTTKASFPSDGSQSDGDPNNSTLFVGGVEANVTDDILRQLFIPFGELISVKIPVGKRCAFVQYASRASAEQALQMLQGTMLAGQPVRIAWGRSLTNKQTQQDSYDWNNASYYGYGGQGYASYGYGQAQVDPNAYQYGAYAGYPKYQQPQ